MKKGEKNVFIATVLKLGWKGFSSGETNNLIIYSEPQLRQMFGSEFERYTTKVRIEVIEKPSIISSQK